MEICNVHLKRTFNTFPWDSLEGNVYQSGSLSSQFSLPIENQGRSLPFLDSANSKGGTSLLECVLSTSPTSPTLSC